MSLAASDVVITASGTATVQAALHEKPMVVVYRLSPLTYLIGKPFVRVDTYAMANLVAGERVVPELIQDEFTPGRVADETVRFLTDGKLCARTPRCATRKIQAKGCAVRSASGRAADAKLSLSPGRRCDADTDAIVLNEGVRASIDQSDRSGNVQSPCRRSDCRCDHAGCSDPCSSSPLPSCLPVPLLLVA